MTTGGVVRIAMVAGEASGDLLASHLIKALKARLPNAKFYGIGGPKMQGQGFDAWYPLEKLAVRGYVEVLKHYREISGIRNSLKKRLLADPPDVFIGVDAPDFNLAVEKALKQRGVPAIHYVSPSIWAWRGKRIHKIGAAVNRVLALFPFEPALYEKEGIPVTYVGHPLAAVLPLEPDRMAARQALGLPESGEVVALLPGSRGSEVRHLAPRFLQAARLLLEQRPGLRCILPAVPAQYERLQQQIAQAGLAGKVQLLQGQSHAALAACDVTLIASGTATLEAALFKRPMVISYAMADWSYRLMQRKQLQPWVGLPNILCQEFVVPEILQDQATPQALAAATSDWLDQSARVAALQQRFIDLHLLLRRDTAALATDAIAQVLAR